MSSVQTYSGLVSEKVKMCGRSWVSVCSGVMPSNHDMRNMKKCKSHWKNWVSNFPPHNSQNALWMTIVVLKLTPLNLKILNSISRLKKKSSSTCTHDELKYIKINLFISGSALNSYISYFEPVYFNTSDLQNQVHDNHLRAKRSLAQLNTISLDFRAQNRYITIILLFH